MFTPPLLAINGILRMFKNVLDGDFTALYITGAILGVIVIVLVVKKAMTVGTPPEQPKDEEKKG